MNKKTLFQFSFIDLESLKIEPVSKYNTHTKLLRDSENPLLKPSKDKQIKIKDIIDFDL